MREQWTQVLHSRCSILLKEAEAKAWFWELRRTIFDWNYNAKVEGDDPYSGLKANTINTELCTIIRWAMDQETIPRADKDRKSAKYNLSDLIKWSKLWKCNASRYDQHRPISDQDAGLISRMKPIIRDWAEAKRWVDIAFEIPMPLKIINEGKLPNRTLSEDGQKQLETWVLTEFGMDCKRVRQEWVDQNYEEIMGRKQGLFKTEI